ncbi:MAG TPA: N-acetylmuramoyl-L-alanine amidase [Acidobacteriota bacterium]|nr:N-acetylmuramoyl-L-alanine amidase [Acidobacteriota bacterium]
MNRVVFSFWLTLTLLSLPTLGRSLQLQTEGRVLNIESRQHQGHALYGLTDIARALGLRTGEGPTGLRVSGPRGDLQLTDGRPLVGAGDQYVLLSNRVWRRSRGDWYVPEDFLTRALPYVLDRRLETVSPGAYRLDALPEMEVRVGVNRYPDHVAVVFEPAGEAQGRVRDLRDYIEVSFQDFAIRPRIESNRIQSEVISGIEFSSTELQGTFRLRKGSRYGGFRQYRMEQPFRLVVDASVSPREAAATRRADPAVITIDPPRAGAAPTPSDQPPPDPLLRIRTERPIFIDPGHGGDDYGVTTGTGISEKTIVFELTLRIQRLLEQEGAPVRLSRTRDLNPTLDRRSGAANFSRAGAFVSLHVGGAPGSAARGPVVYVYGDATVQESNSSDAGLTPWHQGQQAFAAESRRLAIHMQGALNQLFGTENQVLAAPLEVLAAVQAPAILIEAGYLTNPDERGLLNSPAFQDRLAAAIADVLKRGHAGGAW